MILYCIFFYFYVFFNLFYIGLDLIFNEEVDFGFNFDFEVFLGVNDSFLGLLGRDFDILFVQFDDYDIGLNFEGFGEVRLDEEYVVM